MFTMLQTNPWSATINETKNYPLDSLGKIFREYEKFNYVKPECKEDSVVFKYKLPGYEKNEIKIDSENFHSQTRVLKIIAENEEFGTTIYKSVIPNNVDEKSIKASLRNGILTLSFSLEKVKSPFANIKILTD